MICRLLAATAVAAATSRAAAAYDLCGSITAPHGNTLPSPGSVDMNRSAWITEMKRCRTEALASIGYDGSFMEMDRLRWSQTSFAFPMVQGYDRYLWNGTHYTVDKFLADLQTRYGGVDAIFLWPTYENLGVDDRNQLQMFKAMPGGYDALREVHHQFYARGVRVIWGYNPWDKGTARYPPVNASWAQGFDRTDDAINTLAVLKYVDADGIEGDTMQYVPQEWWNASLAADFPLSFSPEAGGSLQSLQWQTMSCCHCNNAQCNPVKNSKSEYTQQVDRYKWLEPRHLTSLRDRWGTADLTNTFHYVFFNGVGYESTENEWGSFHPFSKYNAEALRRLLTILRFFSGGGTKHLISPLWEPHIDGCVNAGVFASIFPGPGSTAASPTEAVWTVVNRATTNYTGPQLANLPIQGARLQSGELALFDCWRGSKLTSYEVGTDGAVTVSFPLPSQGYGCVLVTANASGAGTPLGSFLGRVAAMAAAGPLSSYDTQIHLLQYTTVSTPRVTGQGGPAGAAAAAAPPGMVAVPSAAPYYDYSAAAIEDQSIDIAYYWEATPTKAHSVRIPVQGFFMDRTPVTGAQYGQFLRSTGFWPADPYNFLKNWAGAKSCPAELVDRPVVYVSQAEARQYCAWAGKRLPHEWEWQYAAQGPGNSDPAFPWGNANSTTCARAAGGSPCEPDKVIANYAPAAPAVGQHSPQGDSPFGVQDLVGTVWQYTTEVFDDHSRSNMLRGGSNYMPGANGSQGSHWYFPMVYQTNQHNHYRLMSDSYERAATVGFRCVQDLPPPPPPPALRPGRNGGGGSVEARWSGPPPAYTTLATATAVGRGAPAPSADADAAAVTTFASSGHGARVPAVAAAAEWVLWTAVPPASGTGNGTIHTIRSATGTAGPPAIGTLVCRGGVPSASATDVVTFTWAGAAPPDAATNTSTGAVLCHGGGGFELSIRAAGNGPQTLALFGGLQDRAQTAVLRVVATIDGGGTVAQTVMPALGRDGAGDAVHHITFDGHAGALLNVLWGANFTESGAMAPAARVGPASAIQQPPPRGPYTYTEYPSSNCYHGHGATDIDATPVPNLTAAECMERCDADDTCSCAQYTATGTGRVPPGSCWKRSMCIPDRCGGGGNTQATYVKNYVVHNATNCMDGAGAICIPEPCGSHTAVRSVEQCIELCEGNTACTAALYAADKGWCWQRSAVNVAKCTANAKGYTLLVKPSIGVGPAPGPPGPSPPPGPSRDTTGPMLYAATLSNGPMPPLYGY